MQYLPYNIQYCVHSESSEVGSFLFNNNNNNNNDTIYSFTHKYMVNGGGNLLEGPEAGKTAFTCFDNRILIFFKVLVISLKIYKSVKSKKLM